MSNMYVENARNVPGVMRPLSASQPPCASTATCANAGMLCIAARTMTIVKGIMRQTWTTVTATMALVRSLNQT